MDALTLLHERSSMGKLAAPAPDADQLEAIYQAALRAPDHKELRPWRFIEFSGEGRERLGELYAEAEFQADPDATDSVLNSARKKPLRAPMLIAVIAKVIPDVSGVPKLEQVLSAGCAAHGILLAAHAQGFGAMWRTGKYAFDPVVHKGLGLAEDDELVGFLYLGTLDGRHKPVATHATADFVERWD
ncbi:MAG: nitroreductase family protein [Halomonas sp.]|nr:nitroreductase family protein [Halomonas sp.]MDN6298371.1 nitroreductase family protein [Halomonas sp.]MDN6315257.1 nitroreductase family protein [Halomonas sp.]MDN6336633.1 nitroreductase family protein [Halomonas sp.]